MVIDRRKLAKRNQIFLCFAVKPLPLSRSIRPQRKEEERGFLQRMNEIYEWEIGVILEMQDRLPGTEPDLFELFH